jgi:hypothetical protein
MEDDMSNDDYSHVHHEEANWNDLRNNHGALAAFMLDLIDKSPHKVAIVGVPKYAVSTDRQTTQTERWVSREFDRAKLDRPDLGVKLGTGHTGLPGGGAARLRARARVGGW